MLIAHSQPTETIVSTPISCYSPALESAPWHRQRLILQLLPAEFGNNYLAAAFTLQCLLLVFRAVKIYLQFITNTEKRQCKSHFPKNSYVW
jgi:hypothetical protein